MNLSSVIAPQDVILDLPVPTKAVLIRTLAAHAAARTGLEEDVIHTALMGREKLGSTGIGNGVAIPHAPVAGLDAPFATLVVLRKPIEFDAVDDLPVDIVFLLLSGGERTSEYLKILAAVARKTRDEQVLGLLRRASSPAEAFSTLTDSA